MKESLQLQTMNRCGLCNGLFDRYAFNPKGFFSIVVRSVRCLLFLAKQQNNAISLDAAVQKKSYQKNRSASMAVFARWQPKTWT